MHLISGAPHYPIYNMNNAIAAAPKIEAEVTNFCGADAPDVIVGCVALLDEEE